MPVVKGSIVVDRPIQEVFDLIVDQSKTMQWCLALTECALTTEGELGSGSERVVARKFLGMSMRWTYTCEAFESPTHIAWRSTSGRPPMLDYYDLTEQSGSTHVEHTVDIESMGILRPIQPLMQRRGKKDLLKDLDALKALMESAD